MLVARLTNRRIVVALSIIILIIPFLKTRVSVSKPRGHPYVIIKFISWHWGRFNDIIKVCKVPKPSSYLTIHWSVPRNKLFIDLREVSLPWPPIAILLRGKMMTLMILIRNHSPRILRPGHRHGRVDSLPLHQRSNLRWPCPRRWRLCQADCLGSGWEAALGTRLCWSTIMLKQKYCVNIYSKTRTRHKD